MSSLSLPAHRSSLTSSPVPKSIPAGELQLLDVKTGQIIQRRRIFTQKDTIIGRDKTRCQWSFDDQQLSAKHLRIYTVIYEDEDIETDPLVYAEDLSRYGTYWNGSLIGKGVGGFLLSHEDRLRLTSQTIIRFIALKETSLVSNFDLLQEREMQEFQNEYILTDRLLGAGADGRVFMAIEFATRTQVACKVIDLRPLREKQRSLREGRKFERAATAGAVDSRAQLYKVKMWAKNRKKEDNINAKLQAYYREVEILSSISHPNIISVDKVFVTDDTIYIFLDLVSAGDLMSYLVKKNGKLLESEAAVVTRQIVIAVQFLHQNGIVHRDLKPENVMVTSMSAGARVILTDFGTARRILTPNKRMHTSVGTEQYAAPEVNGRNSISIKKSKVGYTVAADMWSIGTIAVVLLTGMFAFADPVTTNHSSKLASTCNLDHLQQSVEWKLVRRRPKDFITQLLILDEDLRMTAKQALQHPWFSNDVHKVDFESLYKRSTKGWHPRVAKSQVISFQDTCTIERPLTVQRIAEIERRQFHVKKPVEPPYLPFPRKMHMEFWQRKKPRFSMPEEIKVVIDKHWSSKKQKSPQKSLSDSTRFLDPSTLQIRTGRLKYETTHSEPSAREDHHGRCTRSLSPRLRARTPSPEPIQSLEQSLPPSETSHGGIALSSTILPLRPANPVAIESNPFTETTASKEMSSTLEGHTKVPNRAPCANTLESSVSMPPGIRKQSSLRRRSLSTSLYTKESTTMSECRKRRRRSVFDLDDEDESDSSDDENTHAAKKRFPTSKLQTQTNKVSTLDGEVQVEVLPHHRTVMLSIENDGIDSRTYHGFV